MSSNIDKSKRIQRWYFGGVAGSGAACLTHPLDLIKVTMQTSQEKVAVAKLIPKIYHEKGISGFYSGISASLLRQMTYSLTRFGLYEKGKKYIDTNTFGGKLLLASISGTIGGMVGTPGDMMNVRMQNDVKLPPEQRRNYSNAISGLARVYRMEGFKTLFSGCTAASSRGAFMTVGQLAFYDQSKLLLLQTPYFKDNLAKQI